MKKLVHFITSLEVGGAQAVLYNLVVNLPPSSFIQHIIFIHDGPYRDQFQHTGAQLHHVKGTIISYDPLLFYRLVKLLKHLKPDCLHTLLWSANWLGRLAAQLLAIPCINSLHNNSDHIGITRTIFDLCIPNPRYTIAVSHEVKESYKHLSKQIPITVIPNGIDIDTLQHQVKTSRITKSSLGYTDDHIIIGSVGRFHPIKRYPFLLESFACLAAYNKHVRLIIVGSGQAHYLVDLAHKLHIAHLVTWIINQPAYNYYHLFDWFILSSEKEGISIALLEAMSLGIAPIITYHSHKHPVITHGKNGIVAITQNATTFAHIIRSALENKQVQLSLGKEACKTVQSTFALAAMVQAYEHIFQTCNT